MDPRAIYETPCDFSPLPSLDESFAGLILTGHHAMAGTLNGFLDHTQSSAWFDYKINGESVGEIGQETAYAGHFNVPLIMVTGDETACAETQRQFPGAVTVAVKPRPGPQPRPVPASREGARADSQRRGGSGAEGDDPQAVEADACRSRWS